MLALSTISRTTMLGRVQPFRDVDQARLHYLSAAECTCHLNILNSIAAPQAFL
jgi:hypothetical protein